MPLNPKRYRLQAKNIFLTYPHYSLSKDEALEQLISISCPSNKKFIRVARELHENGEPHLHVLIQFEGKARFTNPRHFDLRHSSNSNGFHPNVQGAKSSADINDYIAKDGDFCDWGEFNKDGRSAKKGAQNVHDDYEATLNAETKAEALAILKLRTPRDFVLQYHNISANLDRIFKVPTPPFVSPFAPGSFTNVPRELLVWAEINVIGPAARPYRPISIVIEGDSRTGKTMWARSLGPHNYLCGHLDLSPRVFSNDAWFNVIDDVDPHYLKHFKEFMGAQRDWQSNTKYGKPIQIKGGIPTIFRCNPGPTSSYKAFLEEEKNNELKRWALHNAEFHTLTIPLFVQGSSNTTRHQEETQTDEEGKEQEEAN